MSGAIGYRPVTGADEPFLLAVYGSTRSTELELTPWNEDERASFIRMQYAAQMEHYRNRYPAAEHLAILLDDHQIGRLYLNRGEEAIHILDLTILPEHRNGGAGTAVLAGLLAGAAGEGNCVTTYVESFNRSIGLFERLGFRKAGESGFHVLMKWGPEESDRQQCTEDT